MSGYNWREFADCRPGSGIDSEIFFPIGNAIPATLAEAEAKSICDICPVRATCATDALVRELTDGIFGGLAERERSALLARGWREGDPLPPVRHPTCPRRHRAHGNLHNVGGVTKQERGCWECKRENKRARDYVRANRDKLLAEIAAGLVSA